MIYPVQRIILENIQRAFTRAVEKPDAETVAMPELNKTGFPNDAVFAAAQALAAAVQKPVSFEWGDHTAVVGPQEKPDAAYNRWKAEADARLQNSLALIQ